MLTRTGALLLSLGLLAIGGSSFAQPARYGSQLMPPEERAAHRQTMRSLPAEAREAYRAQHHEQMAERAKELGYKLPKTPPTDRGPGLGPGPGYGRDWAYGPRLGYGPGWRRGYAPRRGYGPDWDYGPRWWGRGYDRDWDYERPWGRGWGYGPRRWRGYDRDWDYDRPWGRGYGPGWGYGW